MKNYFADYFLNANYSMFYLTDYMICCSDLLLNQSSALVTFLIAVIIHGAKATWGGKDLFQFTLPYNNQCITEGSQGRKYSESMEEHA